MQIYERTNQIRKKLLAVVTFALLLLILAVPDMQAQAGNMIIRLSDKNPSIGENLTVTVSVPAGVSASVSVSYPTSLLTYVKSSEETTVNGGTVVLSVGDYGSHERGTETITFKVKASGDAGIAVSAPRATDSEGNQVSVGAASTIVKIKNQTVQNQKSADSSLSSLSVSSGTLSPQFSAQVYNYKLDVENSVSSLDISASAGDAGAKVESVEGADSLVEGKNTVKITVRAEDGTTSVYTIEVNRAKAGETAVDNPGETGDDLTDTPAGDETKEIRLKSEFGYITILSEADTASLPEGYEPRKLSIPDKGEVTAYFCEADPDICLIYAKNDQGESSWYQYDIRERTYLRWYGQGLTASQGGESTVGEKKILELESENRMLFWAFVVVTSVLLVIILILLLKKAKKSKKSLQEEEIINLDGFAETPENKKIQEPETAARTLKTATDEISEIQVPEEELTETELSGISLPDEEMLLQQIGGEPISTEKKPGGVSSRGKEEETKESLPKDDHENVEKNVRPTEKKRWKKNKKIDEEDDGLEFIDL